MKPYYLNDMCLPSIGTFVLDDIIAPYTIIHGTHMRLGKNFHYVENGDGHALNLKGGPSMALRLVEHAQHQRLAIPARHRVKLTNTSHGSRYDGHYLLLDLRTDAQRLGHTRKAILFVVHEGSTFQHYQSNVMTTDAEILAAFEALRTEHAAHAA